MDDKELKDVLYNRLQANGVDVSRNPIAGTAASIKTGAVEGTKQAVNNAASFVKTDLTNTKYAKLNQAKKAAESNIDYDSFMDRMADKYGFKVRILKQSIMDDADKEMYFSAAAAKDLGINNIDDWNKINNEYNTKLSNIESERSAKQQESLTKQQATDRKYMLGTVGEFAQDLGSAAGNMAPSLGLGLINPALGLASFGTQAAAQSYGQALDEGATHEQATRYGVTTGLKEAAIERLTGGLSRFYGKGILDNVIGVQPNNTLRNVILNTAKGAAGEGAEEALSGAIDPFLQRATYNPEAENATLGELGYQAAIGAALGGLLGGGSNVLDYGVSRNATRTQQNAAQQAQTQERTNTTTAENDQLKGVVEQPTMGESQGVGVNVSENMGVSEPQRTFTAEQQQTIPNMENVTDNTQTDVRTVKKEQIPLEFRRFVDKATSGNVGLKKEYAILPDNVNGYIKDNTIYINASKTNDILNAKRIVAHEIYHTFENTQEGQDIYRLALENSGINETDLLQAKKDAYAGVTALDDAGARAEVAADFIEKAMTDEATINRILTTKPNFAQRILQAIKNFISAYKAKRNMTDAEKTEYDRLVNAQKLYEQGFRKLQSGEYQAGVQNVRYSLSDMINQYGAKKQGASPRRDVEYPEATSEFDKTRSFARTVYETEGLNEKVYQGIEENLESDIQNGRFTYEPTSNERNINAANRNISKKGYEDAYTTIKSKFNNDDRFTAEDIATGEMLLKQASEKGDVDKAIDLVGMLSVIGTEYGQTIQAMSLLKRMTPEGRLKQLEGMRKRLESKYPQADIKPLNRKDVEVLLNQKSDVGIDEQAAYMMAKMAEDVPARAWDKVNALRYLAMLGNPRTHIRNTVGNALHFGMLGMKNQVAAAIEKVALPEGERSRSFGIANKELRDFAKQNYQESGQYLLGNKSKYDTNQADGRQIFKTKALETARKTNESLMEFEDNVAKQMGYQLAFANYMKANNYTPEMVQNNKALREKIEAHAADNARRVTFQEASALADALSRFENRKAKSRTEKAAQVAVGAVVPFKRTPINILKEGARFSPAGLIKGLSTDLYDMKQGKISANQVIDDIATGLTGTSILAIGYFLAEMGLLTIGYDSEEARKQNYQSQLGVQNYAFVLPGGGTYTIDWTAPAAMPLLAGAELANSEDGEVGLQRVLNALYNLTNPVLEMSMMQGIQDALQSYSSGAEGIAGSIQSGISGYAGQFVPTLLGQIARTIDETKRSTYAPKDSPITQSGEKLLRTTANKLPGVSMTSEASIDVWGRERQQEGENVITRALNQMLSPGTYASNKSTFVDDEINRLYNAIGESGVIPKSAEKYVRYGDKTYQLSAKDYTAFQKTMGQGNYKDLEKLVKTDVYSSMDDVEKANAIEKIYDYNRYKATSEYLSKKGVTYTNSSYDSMKEKLNTVGGWKNYFELEQAFPDTNFDTALKYKEKCDQYNIDYTTYGNAKTAINDLRTANSDRYTDSGEKTEANRRDTAKYLSGISSLTDPQRQAIWSEIYTGKTSETYKSVANRYGY